MAAAETKSIQQYRRDYDAALRKLKAGKDRVPVDSRRIQANIQHYIDTMDDTGYRQWENCRRAFRQARGRSDADLSLARKLREYLACFGMQRGDRKPFMKDHGKLLPAVSCLMSSEYDALFDLTPGQILNSWSAVEKLCKAASELREALRIEPDYQATTTMITKILMGVYATVPAFDRLLCRSIHCTSASRDRNFPVKHLVRLAKYYEDNADRFQKVVESAEGTLLDYPPMRLVDMVMWREGQLIVRSNQGS